MSTTEDPVAPTKPATSPQPATPAHTGQPAANAQPPDNGKRRLLMTLLVIALLIAAIAYGLYYFLVARFHETTDDAYVNGNVVQITPQVMGTVISVNADDTQTVHAGDPIVVLDPADSKVTLDQAEANLAQAVRQVRTLFVNNDQYAAQVALRQSDLSRAEDDLRRRMTIAQTGAISLEEISHAQDAVRGAQASLNAAEQELQSNRALTENTRLLHQLRPQYDARTGHGLHRATLGAGRPTRIAGDSPDGHRPAELGVGRRQLQGSAAHAYAHRSAR
jgi:membrane fusion protein (multidrug efflux system)